MDFFGTSSSKSSLPIVSRVTVKKVITKPITSTNKPGPSSSLSIRPIGIQSKSSTSKHKSSTLVKTDQRKSSYSSSPNPPKSKSRPSDPTSKGSSRGSTPSIRKKRTPSPVRSESSGSSSDSDDEPGKSKKRKRENGHTVNGLYGVNGSNGVDAVVRGNGKSEGKIKGMGRRKLWDLSEVDERGEYGKGWAGFVTSQEAQRGDVNGWKNGKGEAKGNYLDKYIAYFPQDGFAKTDPKPFVDVLYPAKGCKERYQLLIPTTAREYNPMAELRNLLRVVLEHYIPSSHRHIFGTLSADSLDLDSIPSTPNVSSFPSPIPPSVSTPPPDQPSTASPAASTPDIPVVQPKETIGTALRKALAPNRRDGPGFLKAIERYNSAMEELQNSGEMEIHLKGHSKEIGSGEWSRLVDVVHEQVYSRVVGPYSNELAHHPKHPDDVQRAISGKEDAYGELRHNFMSRIIEQTNLDPSSVFVDLGSGVGNCVLQASLQTGCKSFGVELLPVPAHCARLQLAEVKRRWVMWGLNAGEVTVEEGDFRTVEGIGKWLRDADVVLVNNEVFPPSLNDELKLMFLDLKEGAKVISLRPFVNDGFRMNASNCDSFDAIVRLETHHYYPDWVSWKGDSGKYYVQIIDRSMRVKFEEEMNGGRRKR